MGVAASISLRITSVPCWRRPTSVLDCGSCGEAPEVRTSSTWLLLKVPCLLLCTVIVPSSAARAGIAASRIHITASNLERNDGLLKNMVVLLLGYRVLEL